MVAQNKANNEARKEISENEADARSAAGRRNQKGPHEESIFRSTKEEQEASNARESTFATMKDEQVSEADTIYWLEGITRNFVKEIAWSDSRREVEWILEKLKKDDCLRCYAKYFDERTCRNRNPTFLKWMRLERFDQGPTTEDACWRCRSQRKHMASHCPLRFPLLKNETAPEEEPRPTEEEEEDPRPLWTKTTWALDTLKMVKYWRQEE